jgi:hypothetical protein
MVTTCYLHRWFEFLGDWIREDETSSYVVSVEVASTLNAIRSVLSSFRSQVSSGFDSADRAAMVESLSRAGAAFRSELYANGPVGDTESIDKASLLAFIDDSRSLMASAIRNNRRDDGLYHSYNLLRWTKDGLEVDTLYEMLEGQVAC